MATGPRIRYDIVANAEGGGEVERLAQSLEKLDQAIDPAAAARAQELRIELERLGTERSAVDRFQDLSTATERAKGNLAQAEAALATLRAELQATGTPTTAQTGRMERLGAAVEAARRDVVAQTVALDASRGRLAAFGIDAGAAASAEERLGRESRAVAADLKVLGTALQGVRARELATELQQLGAQQQAVEQVRSLALAADKAQAALEQAQAALANYRARLEGIEAPTTAQIQTQQRLAFAVDDARSKLNAQNVELADSVRSLQRAGIDTADLAVAQERLRNSSQAAVAQVQALAEGYRRQAAAQQSAEASARGMAAATVAATTAARQSGEAINQAFGALNLRSIDAIEAEIEQTSAALARLETAARRGALGQDELGRAAIAAEAKLARLRVEIQRVEAAPTAFARLGASFNDLINRFGALGAAIATVGFAVRPVLDATIALEQMRRTLVTVTGSSEVADKQIAALRRTAQESGQSFTEIGQAYSKFAASALQSGLSLGQVDAVFKSVSLAAGNLGLSSEQAKRALEALSQIASKGVVSMEELRQQLGDALPGVLPLLAKELGLTQRELIKLVESGQLLSGEAIPAIGRALNSLGGQGKVTGLVAEWNRFKNAVLEAGTALTEGPFGVAVGATLKVLGKAVEAVALAAVAMSEAFKLTGRLIYETLNLISTRDLPAFKKAMSDATIESKRMGDAMVQRFLEVQVSTDAIVAAAQKAGDSFAALAVRQAELISAAEKRTQVSIKLTEAADKEAEAVGVLIGLATDERDAAALRVDSTAKVAKAYADAAVAATAEVEALRAAKAAQIEKAGADEQAFRALQPLLAKLDEKIAKSEADAQKQQALAEKMRLVANEAKLAAEKIGDQSGKLAELRAAADAAAKSFTEVSRRFAEGKATQDQLRQASEALARAKNLLRDAIDDLNKKLEVELGLMRSEAALAEAQIKYQIEIARATGDHVKVKELENAQRRISLVLKADEARATLAAIASERENLRSSGQLTAQKEIELKTRENNARAARTDAAAQDVASTASERGTSATRDGTTARERHTGSTKQNTDAVGGNTGSVKGNSDAMRGNAKATDEAAAARERWNDLLDVVNPRLVDGNGLGGLQTGNSKNDPFKDFTNAKIDSFGDLLKNTKSGGITRTASGQFEPPDNSGDWEFDGAGYAAAVSNNRTGIRGADPRTFWRFKPGAVGRGLIADQGTFNGNMGLGGVAGSGGPVRATAPAPPASGALQPVVINLPGRSPVTVQVGSRSEADQLLSVLEDAFKLAGGG